MAASPAHADTIGSRVRNEAESGEGATAAPPVKRGRGRPKGSKNKKPAPEAGAASGPSAVDAEPLKKKRGRPPKNESGAEGDSPLKRKRGRPPKSAAKDGNETEAGASGEPAPKKKRGRPPKNATT